MRVALAVEYDGQAYCGWQRQPHSVSVQAAVESALSRVANEPITVHCSGRTDTGVHAIAQIVHFDTSAKRDLTAWTYGTNSVLARDVSIHWAQVMPEDFHARFSADSRSYRYTILNRPTRPGLDYKRLSWQRDTLDVDRMQAAASCLLGEHDFSSFRSSQCQANHPIRLMRELRVYRVGDRVIIDICANGFLHNMVRIIAGCLMAIGKGEKPIEWLETLLALEDRTQAAATAAPNGLCFLQAQYPNRFNVPTFIASSA